jgi:hypothetical protein
MGIYFGEAVARGTNSRGGGYPQAEIFFKKRVA